MDSLLLNAVSSILNSGNVEPPHASEMPDHEIVNQINLGKPGAGLIAVRKRLAELREADLADLEAKKKALTEELRSEKQVAKDGHFDLKEELAKGTPREKLAEMRAAGEIAEGIAQIKAEEIADVNDAIAKVNRQWSTKSSQVINSINSIEILHRRYVQAYAGGNQQEIRLNPERQARAFYKVISVEELLRKTLDDDELVDSVMEEITTFEVPSSYQEVLWSLMTERDRQRFEAHDPTKSTNEKEQ